MKRRHLMHFIAPAALLMATASGAQADLIGTELVIEVLHSGLIPGSAGGIHKYGQTQSYFTALDFELVVWSPAEAPGYDNAIALDFGEFHYGDLFPNSVGQISLTEIDESVLPGSVAVFAGGQEITAGAVTFDTALIATWNTSDVMNVTTDGPIVTIAWNSIPAPGALALFGLTGLCTRPRRRR